MSNGYYKVCSLQIIHVDENQYPLWMNGGLSVNKHLSNHSEHVIKDLLLEPEKMDKNEGWEFGTANHACIKSKAKPIKFPLAMQELLRKGNRIYTDFYVDQKEITPTASNSSTEKSEKYLAMESKILEQRQKHLEVALDKKADPTPVVDSKVLQMESFLAKYQKIDPPAQFLRAKPFTIVKISKTIQPTPTSTAKPLPIPDYILPIEILERKKG